MKLRLRELLEKCAVSKYDTDKDRANSKKIMGATGHSYFKMDEVLKCREDIKELIDSLHDNFDKGWSMLMMDKTKTGEVWADSEFQIEMLMMIGLAAGLLEYCSSKADWHKLPNKKPYVRRIDDMSVFECLNKQSEMPTFDEIESGNYKIENEEEQMSNMAIEIRYKDGEVERINSGMLVEFEKVNKGIDGKIVLLNSGNTHNLIIFLDDFIDDIMKQMDKEVPTYKNIDKNTGFIKCSDEIETVHMIYEDGSTKKIDKSMIVKLVESEEGFNAGVIFDNVDVNYKDILNILMDLSTDLKEEKIKEFIGAMSDMKDFDNFSIEKLLKALEEF